MYRIYSFSIIPSLFQSFIMNRKLKTNSIIFSLFLVFFLNTGMIKRNLPIIHSEPPTKIQFTPKMQSAKTIKFKHKRKRIKQFFKTQIVDEGALLLAVLAVGVAGVAVYFFFSIGFFIGVIALVVAAFLLYSLFGYLEY